MVLFYLVMLGLMISMPLSSLGALMGILIPFMSGKLNPGGSVSSLRNMVMVTMASSFVVRLSVLAFIVLGLSSLYESSILVGASYFALGIMNTWMIFIVCSAIIMTMMGRNEGMFSKDVSRLMDTHETRPE